MENENLKEGFNSFDIFIRADKFIMSVDNVKKKDLKWYCLSFEDGTCFLIPGINDIMAHSFYVIACQCFGEVEKKVERVDLIK